VKRKDGSIITTECEQADRWVEHFCEVLNHPQPDESANPPSSILPQYRYQTPYRSRSKKNAIKATKSGKATAIDFIHAEIWKADLSTTTRVLTDLFEDIWDKETILSD